VAGPEPDPVDTFPTSAAGAAVIRRLEQRRRFHKSRAQSCSSSDASDDDSENKRKQRTPPITATLVKKDSHHDDSSDSQEPGVSVAAGHNKAAAASSSSTAVTGRQDASGATNVTEGGGGGGKSADSRAGTTDAASTTSSLPGCRRHGRCSSAPGSTGRIRQSHSLNRISELHVVADFSSDDNNNNSSCPSSVASVANGFVPKPPPPPPPLESDADGAPFDMLTRYLESLTIGSARNRSRDDSQNSSDGEYDVGVEMGSGVASRPSSSRRHKVNLRVLEQRLNKIQEENKGSADEDEEEGEVDDGEDDGELSDDPSTLPDEAVNEQNRRNSIVSNRSEAPATALIEQYDPKKFAWRLGEDDDDDGAEERLDDRASTKSCDVGGLMLHRRGSSHGRSLTQAATHVTTMAAASASAAAKCRRPLLRAHSCGSLMSLKERALFNRNLLDLLSRDSKGGGASAIACDPAGAVSGQLTASPTDVVTAAPGTALSLAAAAPLTVLQLQTSSRCCNLC